MPYSFASYEIADLAVQIEETGYHFYTTLSQQFNDPDTKTICLKLAQQELDHEMDFKKIGEEMEQAERQQIYVINVGELMKLVITDLEKAFNTSSLTNFPLNLIQILEIGIHVEKESIRIYTEVKEKFIDCFSDILQKIISEEKDHLQTLLSIKNNL